ncbi:hypothetical protein B0J14DRAFT_561870 [Halenospora varia]|nr:hypothetical protein B0J14DRAFT_561870 [Halenospora varia]
MGDTNSDVISSSSTRKQSEPCQQFHKFGDLPAELRIHIWKEAARSWPGRVIAIHTDTELFRRLTYDVVVERDDSSRIGPINLPAHLDHLAWRFPHNRTPSPVELRRDIPTTPKSTSQPPCLDLENFELCYTIDNFNILAPSTLLPTLHYVNKEAQEATRDHLGLEPLFPHREPYPPVFTNVCKDTLFFSAPLRRSGPTEFCDGLLEAFKHLYGPYSEDRASFRPRYLALERSIGCRLDAEARLQDFGIEVLFKSIRALECAVFLPKGGVKTACGLLGRGKLEFLSAEKVDMETDMTDKGRELRFPSPYSNAHEGWRVEQILYYRQWWTLKYRWHTMDLRTEAETSRDVELEVWQFGLRSGTPIEFFGFDGNPSRMHRDDDYVIYRVSAPRPVAPGAIDRAKTCVEGIGRYYAECANIGVRSPIKRRMSLPDEWDYELYKNTKKEKLGSRDDSGLPWYRNSSVFLYWRTSN